MNDNDKPSLHYIDQLERQYQHPSKSVEIIAEVGSCWTTHADIFTSISLAKAAGADVVKFQYYTYKELYGINNDHGENPSLGVPLELLPQMREKADACGIELMVTAFSEQGVDEINPFVKRHKIAASEASWIDFVQYVACLGKPVIATVGHLSKSDQWIAVQALSNAPHATLLYGEPQYPCHDYNLECMLELRHHGLPIGLSDHSTTSFGIAIEAARLGASVIEKHVQFVPGFYADSCVAIDGVGKFVSFVQAVRHRSTVVHGDRSRFVTQYNRRLIATRDIEKGETFVEGYNYGAYRSLRPDTSAYSANYCLDRNIAACDIRAGEPITKAMTVGS